MKVPKVAVGASLVVFFLALAVVLVMASLEEPGSAPPEAVPVADNRDGEKPPATEPAAEIPVFSAEEVARHDQVDDCWLIISGRVYDVTEYIPRHPAPLRTITDYCGGEATEAFQTKEELDRDHRRSSYRLLEEYFVGRLAAAG